jgi:energy-coupling factor transport system permease protein
MDPMSKVIWIVGVTVYVFAFPSALPGIVAFVMVLLSILLVGKISPRTLAGNAALFLIVGSMLVVFHSVIHPGDVLFSIGPLVFTVQGILTGLILCFRISTVALVSLTLVWTTKVTDLVEGLMALGFPYKLAYAVFITLRYIPLVSDELSKVKDAHAVRGSPTRSRISRELELWKGYLFTVVVNSLRKADVLAIAMDSRGFGAFPRRTAVDPFRWSKSGLAFFVGFMAVAIPLGIIAYVYVPSLHAENLRIIA